MRKIILLLLCFWSQMVFAQVDFNYVSPIKGANYAAIAVDASENVVAVGGNNNLCSRLLIDFFDENGQLQWQRQASSDDVRLDAATDVIFDQFGDIVLVGTNRPGFDVVPDWSDSIYILKLDTLGQTLWYQSYYVEPSFTQHPFVIALTDRTYLVGTTNRLLWLNQNGALRKEQSTKASPIIGLSPSTSHHFTVLSPEKAILYDSTGLEKAAFDADESLFLDVELMNDTTLLLTQESLLVIYDSSSVREISLPTRLEQGWLSSERNGKGTAILYQFSERDANILKYHQQTWDTIQLQLPLGEVLTEFTIFEDQFYFSGRKQLGDIGNPLQGAFLSVTSPEVIPSAVIQRDLSLTSVNVQPIGVVDTFDRIPDWQNPDSIISYGIAGQFEVVFEITNIGAHQVEQLVLFSERVAGFNCIENRLYEEIENVEIIPGETFTYATTFLVSAPFSPNEVLNGINICFSVAAPNHQFDQQNGNNHFCTSLLTNTRNSFLLNHQLKVFPNPATSAIQIELTNQEVIQNIALFDLQGKIQYITHCIEGNGVRIQRGNLPAGMYLVKVWTKNGIGIKKLILH